MSLFNRKQRRAGAQEPRTPQQIRQEYESCCAAAGDKAFQVSILQQQIKQLDERRHALGNEMNQAMAKEQAQKQKEAASAANAPKQD